MSELIINNHLIDAPMLDILNTIKRELTNGKLNVVHNKGENILITCPHHSEGMEHNPSCFVYCGEEKDIEYGTTHCFTCGLKCSLYHLVAECFDKDDEFGKSWLVEHFGNVLVEKQLVLPTISLDSVKMSHNASESILNEFQDYHPYMTQRKLTDDVIKRFKIKYDTKTNCIVFPVWDEFDKLQFLTRRSVIGKQFIIDEGVEKPVYLLNFINKDNSKEVVVCESQINALTCFSYGIPAIALFGTGTQHQYDVLNKSGIRHYILAFDGDDAGRKGAYRFKKNIRKDVFVDEIKIPKGRDVNDLDKQEFLKLLSFCR